ncbi:hypothetical protein BDR26DRAFT_835271 [Obelidium mucronatum]|nr:hypothetical protein BDR26DRAFT_835271 [Obelidium mucronatum]
MDSLLVTAAAAVGAIAVGHAVLKLAHTVANAYAVPGRPLRSFGAAPGSWAIVTGASDGIGREFAAQLAGACGVLLVARSAAKLGAAAADIRRANPAATVRTHVLDLAAATDADWAQLRAVVEALGGPVAILVNNVGTSHEMPVEFLDEKDDVINAIVQVNIQAHLKITQIVAPMLVENKKGLILNIGSLSGVVPCGMLSVYSASKAFLRFWSIALAMELKPKNVHVEHLRAFFVVTPMSKIRKPSWTTPSAKQFVKAALGNLGKSIDSTPYPSHALLMWVIDNFMGESFWIKQSNKMHIDIRKRALRKREREAAAASGKKDL